MESKYMNPYQAGFLIGLVLLASILITGRGLGASGVFKIVVVASVVAIAVGCVLATVPEREPRLIGKASDLAYQRNHPVPLMTADELAFRLLDQNPSIQLVDIRDPESFAKNGLPTAVNIPIEEFFGKQWDAILGARGKTKVFFGEDESAAAAAATLATLLGYKRARVLQGGLREFTNTILQAHEPARELTPEEHDTY
jgi:rhodanese-related sulfurtransferase